MAKTVSHHGWGVSHNLYTVYCSCCCFCLKTALPQGMVCCLSARFRLLLVRHPPSFVPSSSAQSSSPDHPPAYLPVSPTTTTKNRSSGQFFFRFPNHTIALNGQPLSFFPDPRQSFLFPIRKYEIIKKHALLPYRLFFISLYVTTSSFFFHIRLLYHTAYFTSYE